MKHGCWLAMRLQPNRRLMVDPGQIGMSIRPREDTSNKVRHSEQGQKSLHSPHLTSPHVLTSLQASPATFCERNLLLSVFLTPCVPFLRPRLSRYPPPHLNPPPASTDQDTSDPHSPPKTPSTSS
ncbi:hypothetical protein L249_4232 [Ophiocordyceps polyrhachis-furcata BCC 54312]|uniref:Uncharacterized protein n=1 Tax=Ophiocordyceps polyrhachis-furcata BCC 54312 TaxID=1330021 RepID=A0A367LBZ8_9HYPO|nr:hypothetical protein L249_4232 [Ophiocordyceps polyrhachis-furcata BCC 54312]